MKTAPHFKNYAEFWAFYLTQHRHPVCRALHFAGLALGLSILGVTLFLGKPWLIVLGFAVAYGCSWTGHFVFEGNKPATFGHPFWSFISDFRMVGWILRGKSLG